MKSKHYTVIGLETHIQLNTTKKIFCNCKNSYGAPPNTNICPICTGQPGTLPVFNKDVLRKALVFSYALNCKLNLFTRFDRKNYFYPDTPKNYQITQHDYPVGYDGEFYFYSEKGQDSIKIKSIQMEEDSAKIKHDAGDILIDYNRAGIPLLEIISEASFHDINNIMPYLEFLKRTARFLKISNCNMEEGSLRVDANISISTDKNIIPDYKIEIKNLNSFIAVKNSLLYEHDRQIELLSKGKKFHEETRSWDEKNKKTHLLRKKEAISDYRFIPEANIPPFLLSEKEIFALKSDADLTPYFIINNLVNNYHIELKQAYKLTAHKNLYEYFIEVSKYTYSYKKIINWLLGDVVFNLRKADITIDEMKLLPETLAKVIEMIENGELSGKLVKTMLPELVKGKDLDKLIEEKNIIIYSKKELERTIDKIIKDNPKEVKLYKNGKESILSFFIGKVMEETGDQGDPALSKEILINKLIK